MCKVSVIIPTYNCAAWIDRAIHSVVAQTVSALEIIIVDDGSQDNTRGVIDPWVDSGTVKYVFEENRGLPGARNTGAREAAGEYLAFLDADDEFAPDAIEKMWTAAESSGASWCLVDFLRVRGNRSEVQRTTVPDGDPLYAILEHNFVRYGMFFRKSALMDAGMYDESIRMCEDWELNIRMCRQRKLFVHVPEPLYLYTQREGSITTGRIAENLNYTERVFRKHHKRLADSGDRRVRQLYAAHMWDIARKYWYSVHLRAAALRCMRESLRYEFNLGRLLHPIGHLAGRTFQRTRDEEIKLAG
jgi:glycosyltransferase involved in cell wall biosynthesis